MNQALAQLQHALAVKRGIEKPLHAKRPAPAVIQYATPGTHRAVDGCEYVITYEPKPA